MIRNAVWDHLHGYSSPTSTDDVDVIHFDQMEVGKRRDEVIRGKLISLVPNARWPVKNQARMHVVNGEQPYSSINDAIARWPETATAFIARLNIAGEVEFVAPYGFDDLLRLLITNTPAFADRTDVIRRRMADKDWLRLWPRLKLVMIDAKPPEGDLSK